MSSNSEAGPSDVLKPQYTSEEIATFNKDLDGKTPQEILVWAIDHLDGLYQTTAFGLCVRHRD
jgi:phosphoadenosine phosphosulfate reductase